MRQQTKHFSVCATLSSAVFAVVVLLAGCKQPAATGQAGGGAAPPPTPVTVAEPVIKDVVEWDVYTGHLEAPESAQVAARVNGLITEMSFSEGAIVKKGDVLAKVDDRPFKADVDAKKADLQKAQANLSIAEVTLKRLEPLAKSSSVSQQDVDNAKSNVDQANAQIAAANAALELSKLNLDWCTVRSPIDGRVSNKLVTVGNLVTAGGSMGSPTILTTVQSVSPIYCYVDVDERSVLKYQKLVAEGRLTSVREGKIPCYVGLANEPGFPHEGFIDFVDNHVDPQTGTQRVRGVLKNENGVMTPGYFARFTIPGSGRYKATLIPDLAIGTDQDQRTLMVVGAGDKLEVRRVKLGTLFGNLRSIESGIQAGDRVVVNGLLHAQIMARPGAVVAPSMTKFPVDESAFVDPGTTIAKVVDPAPGPAATQPAP